MPTKHQDARSQRALACAIAMTRRLLPKREQHYAPDALRSRGRTTWNKGAEIGGCGRSRECASASVRQRTTSTGIFECVSTFAVSLPSSRLDNPRLPCDAMMIKSHFLFFAVSMIC